jgi:hypothetical protein
MTPQDAGPASSGLMEADDVTLFQRWIADKSDLVEFEVVPVVAGKDTATALAGQL